MQRPKHSSELAERVGDPTRFGVPRSLLNDHAPLRDQHLRRIQQIREGTLPAPRDSGMGHVALSIPEFDYYVLLKRFPELNSRDHDIRHKAWKKFLAGPLSEVYKVNRHEGRRRPGFAAGAVSNAHAVLDSKATAEA